MDNKRRIELIQTEIEKARVEKIKAEQSIEFLEKEIKKIHEEMEELGVNESNIDETIQKLEKDIEDELSKLESIVNEFKGN